MVYIDPFEQYEIVCICTLSGVGGDGSGDEFVLGSVHGAYCTRCYDAGLPSLCNHKHNVSGIHIDISGTEQCLYEEKEQSKAQHSDWNLTLH
jgi:hypothetical protein